MRSTHTNNAGARSRYGKSDIANTILMGVVKGNDDSGKMGRLKVWIPEFGSVESDPSGWMLVSYCSPFAGSTPYDAVTEGGTDFAGSQSSYGMWMVPPDLENQVFVFFVNGNTANGFWFGCAFQTGTNSSVPDSQSEKSYTDDPESAPFSAKELRLPTSERNRTTSGTSTDEVKPAHMSRVRGIARQGLLRDGIRGTNSNSARNSGVSNVYGIKTPGVIDENSPQEKGRLGGNSLIMSDQLGNEHISLKTRSGAQIRIDESNDLIYIINRSGSSWLQMDDSGNFEVFGANSMSLRTNGDFNLRADRNINLEAGANINMVATKTHKEGIGKGATEDGIGGSVNISASHEFNLKSTSSCSLSTGDMSFSASKIDAKSDSGLSLSGEDVNIFGSGMVAFSGASGVDISSDANVNADGAMISLNGGASVPAVEAEPNSASGVETREVKDNLRGFKDENNIDRKTQDIRTITSRLPTYEPYSGHKRK